MRYAAALTPPGTPRPRQLGVRKPVVVLLCCIAAGWAVYGYVQEAYVGHRLAQQVADLRHQNAQIAAQNASYKKDIQGITTGTADEEEARLSGYSKPQEKVFLVTAPPTPSPSPPAAP
jgi:cell division protein FtsB